MKKGAEKRKYGRLMLINKKFRGHFWNTYCSKRNVTLFRGVKAKLECMQDCFAHNAVYHNVCYSNFHADSQIPKLFAIKKQMHRKTKTSQMFGCVLACNLIPEEYGH